MTEVFNLARAIYEVRQVELKVKTAEAALEEKLKDLKDYAAGKRTEILQHLNATGQKSANTPYGTAYWKPKITYRVQDKSEFMAHVVGMEAWELVTWGAAGTAAEAFTEEHGEPPPGTVRNSVNILYVTAPSKPALKVAKAEAAE
jgi:hypothetical protein